MGDCSAAIRRPTMVYWTARSGTIVRAESANSDLVNPGDGVFAAPFVSNSVVGRDLFQFIDGAEVKHIYRALSDRVLKTGQSIAFPYRCDSPAVRREMTMKLSREEQMVRYESALVRETLREKAVPGETPQADTFVAICSFCQDYRFPVSSKEWKELDGLLMEPDLPHQFKFTHSVCGQCYTKVMSEYGLPGAT